MFIIRYMHNVASLMLKMPAYRMSIKCSYANTTRRDLVILFSSCDLETAKYGKVPRSVAIANNVSQY